MQNHHIAIGAVVLVALAGAAYQGCLGAPSASSGAEAELGVIGPEPAPEMPPLAFPDAGPFPSIPSAMPELVPPALAVGPNRCGGLTCPEGSLCCPSTGECFEARCTDCCPLVTTAPELPFEVPSGEEPVLDLPAPLP